LLEKLIDLVALLGLKEPFLSLRLSAYGKSPRTITRDVSDIRSRMYKDEVFMKNIAKVYVGVDISKNNLDVYIYPVRKFFKVSNSKVGIEEIIRELAKHEIARIACEATGGYEKLLAQLLKEHNYSLWIVDPRRIKGFIVASGCKGKTDKIDARKIAEFASTNSPDYTVINKSEKHNNLQALVNRKNDLVKFLAAEKTRLKHPSHALYAPNIKKFIKILKREVKVIELQIQHLIQNDSELCAKSNLLESIPGIGKTTAATLLSFVPELGQLSNKKISALTGVCPYDNESGNYKGKKFIKYGRSVPRKALYMCALTSIKHHLPLEGFYKRLMDAKKPFKVAIVAVMHKLIIIANTVLRKGELCKA
jgi:transposase